MPICCVLRCIFTCLVVCVFHMFHFSFSISSFRVLLPSFVRFELQLDSRQPIWMAREHLSLYYAFDMRAHIHIHTRTHTLTWTYQPYTFDEQVFYSFYFCYWIFWRESILFAILLRFDIFISIIRNSVSTIHFVQQSRAAERIFSVKSIAMNEHVFVANKMCMYRNAKQESESNSKQR